MNYFHDTHTHTHVVRKSSGTKVDAAFSDDSHDTLNRPCPVARCSMGLS